MSQRRPAADPRAMAEAEAEAWLAAHPEFLAPEPAPEWAGVEPVEEIEVRCPWCGEPTSIAADLSGEERVFVEDCVVCCRPIRLETELDEQGRLHAEAFAER